MQGDPLFKAAFEEHQSGNFSAARVLYRKLLVLHPAHIGVTGLIGASLSQEKKEQEGVIYLERARLLDPQHLTNLANLGNAYLASGLLKKSLNTFQALVVLSPENPLPYSGLGQTEWLCRRPKTSVLTLSRALTIHPQDSETRSRLGAFFWETGRYLEATSLIREAIILTPERGENYLNLAVCRDALDETDEALSLLQLGLKLKEKTPLFFLARANIQRRRGAPHESVASTKNTIALDPTKASDYLNLYLDASTLDEEISTIKYLQLFVRLTANKANPFESREMLERFASLAEKRRTLKNLIVIAPDIQEGYFACGRVMQTSGVSSPATVFYERGATIDPDNEPLILQFGILLQQTGNASSASRLLRAFLSRNPSSSEAEYHLGLLAHMQGESALAQKCYNRSINIDPFNTRALVNRGLASMASGQTGRGIKDQECSILISPALNEALLNRGMMLLASGDFEGSSRELQRAVHIDPSLAEPYTLLGLSLGHLKRGLDPAPFHRRAILLDPALAEAYINLADTLTNQKNNLLATRHLEQGLFIKPFSPCGLSHLLHRKHQRFDWSQHDQIMSDIRKSVLTLEIPQDPFALLAIVDDPQLHHQTARLFSHRLVKVASPFERPSTRPRQKIRIGYFSADFHDHATMHLAAEMFELRDRARFEAIFFSFGPDKQDSWRTRAIAACDQFIDIRASSLMESIAMARQFDLDIAVDLKGFTEDSRPEIFKSRVAPVQISYLGYPGTSGLPEMDYIIADPFVIPERLFKYYEEKVIQLPDCYQSNCRQKHISDVPNTRKDHGLPEDGFVFCSFNAPHKIGPEVFNTWARILKRVPKSYLWILVQDPIARENLRKRAEVLGVDQDRILFCPSLPVDQHLARLRLADLFLDTFPYTAHTTASDALRMGLPVLTCSGSSFASRVAGSLLTACGMSEMIVESMTDYENLAVDIALDPQRAGWLKKKAQSSTPSSPLFDSERFTRHIERAFEIVASRSQQGLTADHIHWVDLTQMNLRHDQPST
jgi:predicted O-linked N-acetylglucosamine transferase (SPINDLY family)